MTKLISTLFAAVLFVTSMSAVAMDEMKGGKGMMKGDNAMPMDMKAMDANGDGVISKDEFLKFHEAMWDKMPKNKDGMVDVKNMQQMHEGMMKGGSMKKGDAATKDKPR